MCAGVGRWWWVEGEVWRVSGRGEDGGELAWFWVIPAAIFLVVCHAGNGALPGCVTRCMAGHSFMAQSLDRQVKWQEAQSVSCDTSGLRRDETQWEVSGSSILKNGMTQRRVTMHITSFNLRVCSGRGF